MSRFRYLHADGSEYPTLYEPLNRWLNALHVDNCQSFTQKDWIDHCDGITPEMASRTIQSYMSNQRSKDPRTDFVLKRAPGTRTSSAVWTFTVRTADVRLRIQSQVWDIRCSVERALYPDLKRMGVLNSRSEQVVEASINAMMANIEMMLAGAVA
jgi:hypothetical protein